MSNLIRLIDNYMVSAETHNSNQTPVKVLERFDAMETDNDHLSSELLWDHTIETNARKVIHDIIKHTNQGDTRSSDPSLINVSVSDYLRVFNMNNHSQSSTTSDNSLEKPLRSSTPQAPKVTGQTSGTEDKQDQDQCSNPEEPLQENMSKYISTPDHFPSFNIDMDISSELSGDESKFKIQGKKLFQNQMKFII